MNDQVEEGKAKAAGIVGILIGIIAFIELICGFIYLSKGGPEGSGLWSGVGVNNCYFALIIFSISTVSSIYKLIFRDFFSSFHLKTATDYLCLMVGLHTTNGYEMSMSMI